MNKASIVLGLLLMIPFGVLLAYEVTMDYDEIITIIYKMSPEVAIVLLFLVAVFGFMVFIRGLREGE